MANVKIPIHNRSIKTRKKSLMDWEIPEIEKKKILRFLEELELGKVNLGKKISEGRQSKYLDLLRVPFEIINKPCEKITVLDIEFFERDLSSGKIKSNKKEPYSLNTKVDMRRALKIYLKWRLGEVKAKELAGWLDTKDVRVTPDYLSEVEITKLYKHCKSANERFLIAVLFDAGARAEEFHNIRYEDVQLPKEKESYVKLTIKEEYSKTLGRTISLYWKYSLEAVADYIKERERDGIKRNEPIYNISYDATRKFLQRLGKKVLGKSLHYHLFRHSSATYYAPKLNRQQLCIRYGWKFSSEMPDTYISRAGVDSKEIDEKFTQTEMGDLKVDNTKLKQELEIGKERQNNLEFELDALKKSVKSLLEVAKEK
ncbi:Tyrosine recombinase XerA [uncultured archaeon]|nr:Tyrosine recombinase XerA [uncultured archaeon]